MPWPEQNFHEVGVLASTKFSLGNAQIQLGKSTTCNRVKREIAPELVLTFLSLEKENKVKTLPQLALTFVA